MKKILLSALLLGAVVGAHAQKAEVTEARKLWEIFNNIGIKTMPLNKNLENLEKGLKHTDNAIANEKTKSLAETWSLRASLSSAISVMDTLDFNNSIAKQKIAEEAIAKTKELDKKGDEKQALENAQINVENAINTRAIKLYNKKDYKGALVEFNELIARKPGDTGLYINAGVTAKQMGDFPQAIKHFRKVISFNVPESKDFYREVINMSLDNLKDTTGGLELAREAQAKFPSESDFIGIETDIYITRGDIAKSQELLGKLIEKDPKRAIYQYLMGDTYYKQALNIQEQRVKIDAKKVKEYNALTAKMVALVDQSIPYYKKALELDPKSEPTLQTLKQIYAFKNDTKNYEEVDKLLKALKN
ncbi:hypothetical protein [Pedobacter sp.]|uniref:tetratricopeptide repeat protein n=1 Tax=Pedobacter sp. TaxID=1411316 RepID=UPI00396C54D5